jgi:predicted porin
MFGANYGFGPARVFFNYQASDIADKTSLTAASLGTSKVTTLGVNYDITPSVGLVAAYYKDNSKLAAGGVTGGRSTFGTGVTYSMSKRTMAYAYIDTSTQNAGYSAFAIPAGSDIFGAASAQTSRRNIMFGLRHAF